MKNSISQKLQSSFLKKNQYHCPSCNKNHQLPIGGTIPICLELMHWLESQQHIDYLSQTPSNPLYTTDSLFGVARGKMFGVLRGRDTAGNDVILYAFSGQFNGLWNIPGWAPPLFDETLWNAANSVVEKQIKCIGKEIANLSLHSPEQRTLRKERKLMSQSLMKKLHSLYIIENFRGQRSQLDAFFLKKNGIPTGTGDCCAPKLLGQARALNITPTGISEFYWGRNNKSGTRRHGCFYHACKEKCAPVLGFMLCGLEEQAANL